MKRYKCNIWKIIQQNIQLWLFIILLLVFNSIIPWTDGFYFLLHLFISMMFLPFLIIDIILNIQFLKQSLGKSIEITNTSLKAFIQDHLIVDITKSEVTKIVEVKRSLETAFPGRTYLVIFIGQDYYIIPSYIISSEKFFNNFGTYQNKIISYQIIPFIKPKKFLLATKPVRFSLENVGDEPVMISSPNLKTLRIVLPICFIATCILVYWISDELFILILLLTIICFTILYMQKSVFITKTHLIIRHWGRELTIPHKDIESVTEINFYKIFGDSYESALKIKYLRYSYEKQSVVFYPKDNVLNELKKILDTEYLKYFKPWSEYFDFLKKNNDLK